MRGLHAAFTQSIKAEATCTGRVANIVEAGNDREAAADACTEIDQADDHSAEALADGNHRHCSTLGSAFLVMKVGVQPRSRS